MCDLLGSSWLTLGGRPSDSEDTEEGLLILADWALRMAVCTADCTADWAGVGWLEEGGRCPLVRDWVLWVEELGVVLWARESWFRTWNKEYNNINKHIPRKLSHVKKEKLIQKCRMPKRTKIHGRIWSCTQSERCYKKNTVRKFSITPQFIKQEAHRP